MFEQLVQYALDEVRLIAKAPAVFGAALLLLGAIIWAALRWRYSGIIRHRNGIIALYKARLDGATPDQARAKMDSLEGQVQPQKPRMAETYAGCCDRFRKCPYVTRISCRFCFATGQRFGLFGSRSGRCVQPDGLESKARYEHE